MSLTMLAAPDFGYSDLKSVLDSFGPPEMSKVRANAFDEYQRLGLPHTKLEDWKYVGLAGLEALKAGAAYGANVYRSELEGSYCSRFPGFTLAFVNGQEAPELHVSAPLPKGVFVGTLQEAWDAIPEVLDKHLAQYAGTTRGKLGAQLDAPFVQLNTAFLSEGAVVYVPKGVACETAIQILSVNRVDEAPFSSHPRILIVLEEGAQAKVLESYIGLKGANFTNSVVEIVLERGANLEHTKVQTETSETIHFATAQVQQAEDSVYTGNVLSFGAKLSRSEVNAWVGGEHAETWLNGAYVGKGDQVHANQTRIDHAVPNCNSFEVYKGILDDASVGVFNGKIFVYEDAQKTDAKQTNQALLLSPTAQINTKPQLEIFADDVKCTHGATVGQLRKDALFYLKARGIPQKKAEALLVYAFAAEVIEKVTIPGLAELLEAELFQKLGMSPTTL